MTASRVAQRREHTGTFAGDQAQLLARHGASKLNEHTDALAVLANRAYAALATDSTTASATYATLLTANITTRLARGFLIITFTVSGTQITAAATISFQIVLNGTVVKGAWTTVPAVNYSYNVSMMVRCAVVRGPQVVKLQWNSNAATARVRALSTNEEHAHLLVQEAA